MAHFAQLDADNKVISVLVVDNADITDENGVEQEQLGIAFLQGLLGPETTWVQTSYNASMRGVYAGIGYTYDPAGDVFVAPVLEPGPEPEPEAAPEPPPESPPEPPAE